jgi:AcrR family transcriptional regulator
VFPITRVTKDFHERETELIDTACELFFSLGYQNTNVSDIVKKVGVAQGTFYYYFPSKEAILEAIFARHVKNMVAQIQDSGRKQITPFNKLQLFVNLFYKLCYEGEPGLLAKILYKENQGVLINRLWRQTHMLTNPILIRLLEECNQARVTNITHMSETLSFFAGIIASLLEASSPLEFAHESDPEIVKNKVKIAEKLIETLFNCSEGSIHLEPPV